MVTIVVGEVRNVAVVGSETVARAQNHTQKPGAGSFVRRVVRPTVWLSLRPDGGCFRAALAPRAAPMVGLCKPHQVWGHWLVSRPKPERSNGGKNVQTFHRKVLPEEFAERGTTVI